jgi:hypothetical protein
MPKQLTVVMKGGVGHRVVDDCAKVYIADGWVLTAETQYGGMTGFPLSGVLWFEVKP